MVGIVKEPTSEDTFAEAFAQLAATETSVPAVAAVQAAAPAAETPEVPEVPEVPDEGVEGLPTPEEEAAAAAKAVADAAAAEAAAKVAKPEVSDDDILKRLAGVIRKTEPVQPQPQQQQQPEPEAPYTPDEMAAIDTYVKDFPEVSRAEQLIRRTEYQHLVSYVFQEISKELQPLQALVRSITERTHLGDLQTAVPDYNDTREAVIAWAQQQPTYLQPAYAHVINRGTVEEVADLIQRYKQATGAQLTPPVVPAKVEAELSPAAKKAVAALAPVGSKRTVVVAPNDPGDFEGAFAQFARAADKL